MLNRSEATESKRREENLQRMKEATKQTFKPEINKRSKVMAGRTTEHEEEAPAFQRLLTKGTEYASKKEKQQLDKQRSGDAYEAQCTFAPQIKAYRETGVSSISLLKAEEKRLNEKGVNDQESPDRPWDTLFAHEAAPRAFENNDPSGEAPSARDFTFKREGTQKRSKKERELAPDDEVQREIENMMRKNEEERRLREQQEGASVAYPYRPLPSAYENAFFCSPLRAGSATGGASARYQESEARESEAEAHPEKYQSEEEEEEEEERGPQGQGADEAEGVFPGIGMHF